MSRLQHAHSRNPAIRHSWPAVVGVIAILGLVTAACGQPAATPTTAPTAPAKPKPSPVAKPAVSPVPSPGVAVSPVASPTALPPLVAVTANRADRSLSVIDVTAGRVLGTVSLDRPPFRVALSPDAQLAFASDASQGSQAVVVAAVASQRQTDTLQVGAQPVGIDVHAVQPLAVVANSADDSITIYDAKTRAVSGTVQVGDRPTGVVLVSNVSSVATPAPSTQAFTWAYVTNAGEDSVSVVDVDNRQLVTTVRVGDNPTSIAAARDGSRVFVLNEGSGSVSVIEVPGNQQVTEIQVGSNLTDLAVSPSLDMLYVTARDPSRNLYRIDLNANQVAQTFNVLGGGAAAAPSPGLSTMPAPSPGVAASPVASPVATGPGALAVAAGPDPDLLLVTTTEDNLVSWSIANNRVTRTVRVGRDPVDVAIAAAVPPVLRPSGSPVAQPTPRPATSPAATAQPAPTTAAQASPTVAAKPSPKPAAPPSTPTSPPASPTSEASPTTAPPQAGAAQEVSVEMTEFNFRPSAVTVQAGQPVRLTAQNTGSVEHNWTVAEGGLTVAAEAQPDQSTTVTFTPQQSGTFRVICTEPGHAEAGMVGQLVVQ